MDTPGTASFFCFRCRTPCFSSLSSFLLVEMELGIDGALCWMCKMIGIFFFFHFFSLPQRQHCFIQDPLYGFIAPRFYCMWLCCLSICCLVGIAMSFFCESYILCVNAKKNLLLIVTNNICSYENYNYIDI